MAEPAERYPSPSGNGAALPFYQPGAQAPPRSQHSEREEDDRQQDNGRVSGSPRSQTSASTQHEASGNAQQQPNPTNNSLTMGSFGAFGGAPPAQNNSETQSVGTSGIPHGSIAYAQYSGSSDAAPPPLRKEKAPRTKSSRACDECRRKKIRCDAIDETGTTPCTNCARTGSRCRFSRTPQKRGPSKGYIKELAERLNTLEQQVHPPHMQQQHQHEIQQLQQAMADGLQASGYDPRMVFDPRAGDKRPYDVAEGLHNGQSQFPQQPYLHPAGSSQPFWRHGPQDNRQDPVGLSYDAESSTTITNFDWDEAVIDEYYRIIHQTFPLLPHNRHRLRQRLAECPTTLREAFLAALDCLMRTFPTTSLPPNTNYPQALKRTAELLAQYPFDNPASHTNATNLIYLQTLLMMALESDNHGPATIRGQAGPSRAEWLGRAAGVAGQLEINTQRMGSTSVMEGDRDSEDRLARRVWWVLFILDRWHASSTADLLKLPENSVVLLPEDQILLGESTYHLARLSFIIGHLAAILTTTKTPSTDVMSPSNPASSLLGLTLAGEIDRFRESVESVWGSLNLVHLSYHHCHLLIKRLNPTIEPTELVGHAVKVATVLNSKLTPVTPLNHHFGALAAMTLCELCDLAKTRTEAIKGLDQMAECLGEGRGLAGKLESEGWDGAVRELVKKKRERMQQYREGLQGLADAAAAADAKFDPTMLTRYGYLTSLGQGVFGRDGL